MLSGLTYNVFLGKKLEPLLTWLQDEVEPLDIYCFQEFPEAKIPDIKARFGHAGYDVQFAPGLKWRGVVYGELTMVKRGKVKLVASHTLSLGGKGELQFVFIREGLKFDVKIARIQIDRTALVTTMQAGGWRFSIANTHLCSDIHNSRKLKQLASVIDSFAADQPAIILGDFNYPFGRGLPKLMKRSGFTSTFLRQKTFRFAPGIYWQNDYIFQRGVPVTDICIERAPYSDHYPIFFKIDL